MHGSRSKIPSKKSCPYIYDVKFLALLGAPYIYDISGLKVNIFNKIGANKTDIKCVTIFPTLEVQPLPKFTKIGHNQE
jgi:hypothetical protein